MYINNVRDFTGPLRDNLQKLVLSVKISSMYRKCILDNQNLQEILTLR